MLIAITTKVTVHTISPRIVPRTIADECRTYDFDYARIRQQIFVESSWRHYIISDSGAVGYMQVRPSTAGDMHGRTITTNDLKDSIFNVVTGLRYLRHLMKFFHALGYRNKDLDIVTWSAYWEGPGNTIRRNFMHKHVKAIHKAFYVYDKKHILPKAMAVEKAKPTIYTNKIGIF